MTAQLDLFAPRKPARGEAFASWYRAKPEADRRALHALVARQRTKGWPATFAGMEATS